MQVRSLGLKDPLEEGMATCSSILAWKTPWMESGGLQSIGLQRDTSLIPGLGRYLRVGNGNLLQYSCLESFMDRGV